MKNVIFILPDQLRADFLSCYGADFIDTPHIDALCENGLRFVRAVSPSPLCVPARASMLTGLNSLKTGVLDNFRWLRPDRDQIGITTWVEDLAARGYHTEAIGKMHFTPWDLGEGFQHRVIAEDKRHLGIQDDYAQYLHEHGLRRFHGNEHDGYFENRGAIVSKIPAEHQVDKWVADRSIEFLENADASQPFALMIGFPGPHCPYDPPVEYAKLFDPELMPDSIPVTPESDAFREQTIDSNKRDWNQVDYTEFTEVHKRLIRARYAALVKQIDDQVGRLVETLRQRDLHDNTVIIFASDHGDFLGDFDLIGKHFFYEPSIHVPLIIHHPQMDGTREIARTVSITDITETIRDIAGIAPADMDDSVSLLSERIHQRACVFGATDVGIMVTTDEWKLCRYDNGVVELYHLVDDPTEQNNLAYQPETIEIMAHLDRLLQQHVLASSRFAHDEKRILDAKHLDPASAFSQRDWQRQYPAPIEELRPEPTNRV